MTDLKTPELVPIKAIPGLFIADRFAASSPSQLRKHNIVRIISVLQPHENTALGLRLRNATLCEITPGSDQSQGQPDSRAPQSAPEFRVLPLDDDPLVDILEHLKEACDWIQEGLNSSGPADRGEGTNKGEGKPAGVLVHCQMGVSRSGAFIVGFMMRNLKVPFATALNLARESRPQITPNGGFEKQLRVWEFCKYEIYEPNAGSDNEIAKTEVLGSNTGDDKDPRIVRKEKAAYRAWKVERDELLQDKYGLKARFSSMGATAARFGRLRLEGGGGEETKKKEAWENVQRMEKDWNDRLIRGGVVDGNRGIGPGVEGRQGDANEAVGEKVGTERANE